jgi:hypothetical protein
MTFGGGGGRSKDMIDADPRIRELAQVVVERHGQAALGVVTERIRFWLEAEDYGWVAVWAEVADRIGSIARERGRPRPAPRLPAHRGLRR